MQMKSFFTRFSGCRAFIGVLFVLATQNNLSAQNDPPPPVEDIPVTTIEEPGENNVFHRNNYTLFATDTLLLRKVPDSIIGYLQRSEDFWYANYNFGPAAEKKKKDKRTDSISEETFKNLKYDTLSPGKKVIQPDSLPRSGSRRDVPTESEKENTGWLSRLAEQSWVSYLLWFLIIGGFLYALIAYLINSDVGLFRKKNKRVNEKQTGDEEEMPENIFEIQYMSEIDRAAAQGNYRLAIRLMYLELLKNCTERNIIQYKQERTNFDYLMQLAASPLYKDFFRLTRHFEYAWYGKFDISPDAYGIIKNEFNAFNQKFS